MNISRDTVKYVANLARIELTDKELDRFCSQLNDILAYIDQLKEVDISNIAPTTHVLPIRNIKRKDLLCHSFDTKKVLENAPKKQGAFFKVPKVIE